MFKEICYVLNTLYNDEQQAFSVYVKILGFIRFATDKDFPHPSGSKMKDIDATTATMQAAFKNSLLLHSKRNYRRLCNIPHVSYLVG